MKQLSFLDLPRAQGRKVIWSALDDPQKAEVVTRLARLIAQAVSGALAEQEEDGNE